MTDLDIRRPEPAQPVRAGRSLPHGIRPGGADRRPGHRPRTGRTARARRACRPAGGDVRLGISGQPARWCRPDAGRDARRPAGTRHHLRPRPQRGTGGDLGVGQPGRPARWARHPTTGSLASGTARGPAWTGRPTPSGTPTCTAPTLAAGCCSWSATTRPPSPPPCPPSASDRWPHSASRCCSRATPARSSPWPCTVSRCRAHRDALSR